jgi:uncharacterized lipoprotein YddW (UPF0748 family)
MKLSRFAGRSRGRRLFALLLVASGCMQTVRGGPRPSVPATAPPSAPAVLPAVPVDLALDAPPIRREFRGVWVAAVENMDWPSRPGLPPERQRAELVAILDRAEAMGLNAVLLQVRPSADALYPSPYEPWSEYLTGKTGRAPEPLYDPLEFAVREAHRRGLELHAWFNPFRARDPSAVSTASADHVTRAHPEWVRKYGSYLWMDPAEPAVQDQAVRVILDVVRRYDIDGVHIDDYFYPYRETDSRGRTLPFPDDAAYTRYRNGGGTLGRSDWRRSNVDRFVERIYGEVKREKPEVKFGISPFGIWRPGYPAQIQGLDAYEEIYADARKWLNNGWLDYFVPQLYWPVQQTAQAFPVLLDWWVRENRAGRHIWPGSFSGRVGTGSRDWPAREIVAQIDATRAQPGATGNVLFSMSSLMRDRDALVERLRDAPYAASALVPPSPWLHRAAPLAPHVTLRGRTPGHTDFDVVPQGAEEVFLWTVRARTGSTWETRVVPGWNQQLQVTGDPDRVVITAIGRTGNESPPAIAALP